jgi:hypothetical protein
MGIQRLDGKCTLPVVLLCFLVACGGELRGATSLRLSRQGYSPITKTLLIHSANTGDRERRSFLVTYDEVSGSVKRVAIPGNRALFDFAWVPGRAAFIGTDLEQVILFQKDTSGDGYTPTPIQRPGAGILPSHCSWSPKGQWLAVNCLSLANVTHGELWLYQFGDTALRKTGVALDYRAVIWENDGLLYGTKDNAVLTVKLTAEKPSIVRTVPVLGELTVFYGMFGEHALLLSDGQILQFGGRILAALDRRWAKVRVMGTDKTIFVSVPSKDLIAFDRTRNEIARSNPGRPIQFGSVKDPNTVYGLADSSLVSLSVAKGALKIQTVADLGSLTGMGPGGILGTP